MNATSQITFNVRRCYDERTCTWTLIVNDENVLECLDDETNADTTDEEAVFWYLSNSKHNPENRK